MKRRPISTNRTFGLLCLLDSNIAVFQNKFILIDCFMNNNLFLRHYLFIYLDDHGGDKDGWKKWVGKDFTLKYP